MPLWWTSSLKPHLHVVLADLECGKANVMFVVDASHSVGAENWFKVKQWVIDVMSSFNIASAESHVGVVIYSTTVSVEIGLDDSYDVEVLKRKFMSALRIFIVSM